MRRPCCRNATCARRAFAERLPEPVAPARRTCRLAAAQARVGVALGGNAGSRLLRHLAMPAGADTLLRLVSRLPLPARETLLGIARETGLALGPVRKHARAETLAPWTSHGPCPGILGPCLAHLERAWQKAAKTAFSGANFAGKALRAAPGRPTDG